MEKTDIENTEEFNQCFQNRNDPAFLRYMLYVRHFKDEYKQPDTVFRKNRSLPDGFEKMFIVPKEYLKFHPSSSFDVKSRNNTVIITHEHFLKANLELLAYFNKRDDEVQLELLKKLKRMIYWRVYNKTNTVDIHRLDVLYLKIKSFSRLNQNDFNLFSDIMKGHYNERKLRQGRVSVQK